MRFEVDLFSVTNGVVEPLYSLLVIFGVEDHERDVAGCVRRRLTALVTNDETTLLREKSHNNVEFSGEKLTRSLMVTLASRTDVP